jgi:hypothetical protein
MTEFILTQPPAAPPAIAVPPSARWGFWGTCAWGVAALAAFYTAQIVALFGVLVWRAIGPAHSVPTDFAALGSSAIVVAPMTLTSLAATLPVLALAVRLARIRFVDYFAVYPIGLRTILFALVCLLGYTALVSVITYALGRPMVSPFAVSLYKTGRESGTLWLVLIALVVAAPISEEFLVRGFLFRGWARSRLGAVGAVVLTSLIWAATHVQYDRFEVTEIFGLGLLFGWLRYRSGSLTLT